MRSPLKLAFTTLLILLPLCATTSAQNPKPPQQPATANTQHEKTSQQIAAERKSADQAVVQKYWNDHCKTAYDAAEPPKGMRLLTGLKTGYYYKVGIAISQVVAEKTSRKDGAPLEISPVDSGETNCNLLGLETKNESIPGTMNADFAIVQSDIAHDAWFAHPPVRSTPAKEITLIAPLFVEAVHIVMRPHLNLAHLSDLRGRRVYLGPKESLTVLTAKRILDAAGLTQTDVAALDKSESTPDRKIPACKNSLPSSISDLDPDCALRELQRFKLDAVFQVGAVPYDSLHDVIVPSDTNGQLLDAERKTKPCDAVRKARLNDPSLIDSELRLFNLDVDLVERLVADGSYIEQLIPPEAYCQDKATLTVGVRALLLTNLGEADPVVRRLATTLNANQTEIETNLRRQMEVEQQAHGDAITGNPSKLSLLRVPTPPALVVRYHPEITADKIYFNPWKRFATKELPILAAGLLIFCLLVYSSRRVLGPWVGRHGEFAIGLPLFVLLWVVTSVVLKHYYEGPVNEDFSTFPTAMLSTLKNLIPFTILGSGPVTRNGQNWLSGYRWLALAIFSGMLLPTIRQGLAKAWAFAKTRLLRLGHPPTPAPSPAHTASPSPETPGAADHGVTPRPAPTH